MKYATKLINLHPIQMRLLKAEARRRKIPVNQVVRSAVSMFLAEMLREDKKGPTK